MNKQIVTIGIALIFLAVGLSGCNGPSVEEEENQSLTCSMFAVTTFGKAPLTVTFTIIASDADGSIASWTLDIDDDGILEYNGSGKPPAYKEHTYQDYGTYTASLTVTDNYGATCTTTEIITISNMQPICSLAATLSLKPLTKKLIMTATDPDGTITSWTLDTDNDGIPEYNGSGKPPAYKEHTYQDYGTYTASLTVTDNYGATCTATDTFTVTV